MTATLLRVHVNAKVASFIVKLTLNKETILVVSFQVLCLEDGFELESLTECAEQCVRALLSHSEHCPHIKPSPLDNASFNEWW